MLEIKYRDQDGDEGVLLTDHLYLHNDPAGAAQEVAEDDRNQSGGDLYDPDCWPREYEIFHRGEWVKVSVDMEYTPSFSASVNK